MVVKAGVYSRFSRRGNWTWGHMEVPLCCRDERRWCLFPIIYHLYLSDWAADADI